MIHYYLILVVVIISGLITIYIKQTITCVQIDFSGEAVPFTLDGSTDFFIKSHVPSASVNIIVSHSSSLKQFLAQSITEPELGMVL